MDNNNNVPSPTFGTWTKTEATQLNNFLRQGKTTTMRFYSLLSSPYCDINVRDTYGLTPLIVAIDQGFEAAIELLLSHPTLDINRCDLAGWTPIMHAVFRGNLSTIVSLLNRVDINLSQFSLPPYHNSILIEYFQKQNKKKQFKVNLHLSTDDTLLSPQPSFNNAGGNGIGGSTSTTNSSISSTTLSTSPSTLSTTSSHDPTNLQTSQSQYNINSQSFKAHGQQYKSQSAQLNTAAAFQNSDPTLEIRSILRSLQGYEHYKLLHSHIKSVDILYETYKAIVKEERGGDAQNTTQNSDHFSKNDTPLDSTSLIPLSLSTSPHLQSRFSKFLLDNYLPAISSIGTGATTVAGTSSYANLIQPSHVRHPCTFYQSQHNALSLACAVGNLAVVKLFLSTTSEITPPQMKQRGDSSRFTQVQQLDASIRQLGPVQLPGLNFNDKNTTDTVSSSLQNNTDESQRNSMDSNNVYSIPGLTDGTFIKNSGNRYQNGTSFDNFQSNSFPSSLLPQNITTYTNKTPQPPNLSQQTTSLFPNHFRSQHGIYTLLLLSKTRGQLFKLYNTIQYHQRTLIPSAQTLQRFTQSLSIIQPSISYLSTPESVRERIMLVRNGFSCLVAHHQSQQLGQNHSNINQNQQTRDTRGDNLNTYQDEDNDSPISFPQLSHPVHITSAPSLESYLPWSFLIISGYPISGALNSTLQNDNNNNTTNQKHNNPNRKNNTNIANNTYSMESFYNTYKTMCYRYFDNMISKKTPTNHSVQYDPRNIKNCEKYQKFDKDDQHSFVSIPVSSNPTTPQFGPGSDIQLQIAPVALTSISNEQSATFTVNTTASNISLQFPQKQYHPTHQTSNALIQTGGSRSIRGAAMGSHAKGKRHQQHNEARHEAKKTTELLHSRQYNSLTTSSAMLLSPLGLYTPSNLFNTNFNKDGGFSYQNEKFLSLIYHTHDLIDSQLWLHKIATSRKKYTELFYQHAQNSIPLSVSGIGIDGKGDQGANTTGEGIGIGGLSNQHLHPDQSINTFLDDDTVLISHSSYPALFPPTTTDLQGNVKNQQSNSTSNNTTKTTTALSLLSSSSSSLTNQSPIITSSANNHDPLNFSLASATTVNNNYNNLNNNNTNRNYTNYNNTTTNTTISLPDPTSNQPHSMSLSHAISSILNSVVVPQQYNNSMIPNALKLQYIEQHLSTQLELDSFLTSTHPVESVSSLLNLPSIESFFPLDFNGDVVDSFDDEFDYYYQDAGGSPHDGKGCGQNLSSPLDNCTSNNSDNNTSAMILTTPTKQSMSTSNKQRQSIQNSQTFNSFGSNSGFISPRKTPSKLRSLQHAPTPQSRGGSMWLLKTPVKGGNDINNNNNQTTKSNSTNDNTGIDPSFQSPDILDRSSFIAHLDTPVITPSTQTYFQKYIATPRKNAQNHSFSSNSSSSSIGTALHSGPIAVYHSHYMARGEEMGTGENYQSLLQEQYNWGQKMRYLMKIYRTVGKTGETVSTLPRSMTAGASGAVRDRGIGSSNTGTPGKQTKNKLMKLLSNLAQNNTNNPTASSNGGVGTPKSERNNGTNISKNKTLNLTESSTAFDTLLSPRSNIKYPHLGRHNSNQLVRSGSTSSTSNVNFKFPSLTELFLDSIPIRPSDDTIALSSSFSPSASLNSPTSSNLGLIYNVTAPYGGTFAHSLIPPFNSTAPNQSSNRRHSISSSSPSNKTSSISPYARDTLHNAMDLFPFHRLNNWYNRKHLHTAFSDFQKITQNTSLNPSQLYDHCNQLDLIKLYNNVLYYQNVNGISAHVINQLQSIEQQRFINYPLSTSSQSTHQTLAHIQALLKTVLNGGEDDGDAAGDDLEGAIERSESVALRHHLKLVTRYRFYQQSDDFHNTAQFIQYTQDRKKQIVEKMKKRGELGTLAGGKPLNSFQLYFHLMLKHKAYLAQSITFNQNDEDNTGNDTNNSGTNNKNIHRSSHLTQTITPSQGLGVSPLYSNPLHARSSLSTSTSLGTSSSTTGGGLMVPNLHELISKATLQSPLYTYLFASLYAPVIPLQSSFGLPFPSAPQSKLSLKKPTHHPMIKTKPVMPIYRSIRTPIPTQLPPFPSLPFSSKSFTVFDGGNAHHYHHIVPTMNTLVGNLYHELPIHVACVFGRWQVLYYLLFGADPPSTLIIPETGLSPSIPPLSSSSWHQRSKQQQQQHRASMAQQRYFRTDHLESLWTGAVEKEPIISPHLLPKSLRSALFLSCRYFILPYVYDQFYSYNDLIDFSDPHATITPPKVLSGGSSTHKNEDKIPTPPTNPFKGGLNIVQQQVLEFNDYLLNNISSQANHQTPLVSTMDHSKCLQILLLCNAKAQDESNVNDVEEILIDTWTSDQAVLQESILESQNTISSPIHSTTSPNRLSKAELDIQAQREHQLNRQHNQFKIVTQIIKALQSSMNTTGSTTPTTPVAGGVGGVSGVGMGGLGQSNSALNSLTTTNNNPNNNSGNNNFLTTDSIHSTQGPISLDIGASTVLVSPHSRNAVITSAKNRVFQVIRHLVTNQDIAGCVIDAFKTQFAHGGGNHQNDQNCENDQNGSKDQDWSGFCTCDECIESYLSALIYTKEHPPALSQSSMTQSQFPVSSKADLRYEREQGILVNQSQQDKNTLSPNANGESVDHTIALFPDLSIYKTISTLPHQYITATHSASYLHQMGQLYLKDQLAASLQIDANSNNTLNGRTNAQHSQRNAQNGQSLPNQLMLNSSSSTKKSIKPQYPITTSFPINNALWLQLLANSTWEPRSHLVFNQHNFARSGISTHSGHQSTSSLTPSDPVIEWDDENDQLINHNNDDDHKAHFDDSKSTSSTDSPVNHPLTDAEVYGDSVSLLVESILATDILLEERLQSSSPQQADIFTKKHSSQHPTHNDTSQNQPIVQEDETDIDAAFFLQLMPWWNTTQLYLSPLTYSNAFEPIFIDNTIKPIYNASGIEGIVENGAYEEGNQGNMFDSSSTIPPFPSLYTTAIPSRLPPTVSNQFINCVPAMSLVYQFTTPFKQYLSTDVVSNFTYVTKESINNTTTDRQNYHQNRLDNVDQQIQGIPGEYQAYLDNHTHPQSHNANNINKTINTISNHRYTTHTLTPHSLLLTLFKSFDTHSTPIINRDNGDIGSLPITMTELTQQIFTPSSLHSVQDGKQVQNPPFTSPNPSHSSQKQLSTCPPSLPSIVMLRAFCYTFMTSLSQYTGWFVQVLSMAALALKQQEVNQISRTRQANDDSNLGTVWVPEDTLSLPVSIPFLLDWSFLLMTPYITNVVKNHNDDEGDHEDDKANTNSDDENSNMMEMGHAVYNEYNNNNDVNDNSDNIDDYSMTSSLDLDINNVNPSQTDPYDLGKRPQYPFVNVDRFRFIAASSSLFSGNLKNLQNLQNSRNPNNLSPLHILPTSSSLPLERPATSSSVYSNGSMSSNTTTPTQTSSQYNIQQNYLLNTTAPSISSPQSIQPSFISSHKPSDVLSRLSTMVSQYRGIPLEVKKPLKRVETASPQYHSNQTYSQYTPLYTKPLPPHDPHHNALGLNPTSTSNKVIRDTLENVETLPVGHTSGEQSDVGELYTSVFFANASCKAQFMENIITQRFVDLVAVERNGESLVMDRSDNNTFAKNNLPDNITTTTDRDEQAAQLINDNAKHMMMLPSCGHCHHIMTWILGACDNNAYDHNNQQNKPQNQQKTSTHSPKGNQIISQTTDNLSTSSQRSPQRSPLKEVFDGDAVSSIGSISGFSNPNNTNILNNTNNLQVPSFKHRRSQSNKIALKDINNNGSRSDIDHVVSLNDDNDANNNINEHSNFDNHIDPSDGNHILPPCLPSLHSNPIPFGITPRLAAILQTPSFFMLMSLLLPFSSSLPDGTAFGSCPTCLLFGRAPLVPDDVLEIASIDDLDISNINKNQNHKNSNTNPNNANTDDTNNNSTKMVWKKRDFALNAQTIQNQLMLLSSLLVSLHKISLKMISNCRLLLSTLPSTSQMLTLYTHNALHNDIEFGIYNNHRYFGNLLKNRQIFASAPILDQFSSFSSFTHNNGTNTTRMERYKEVTCYFQNLITNPSTSSLLNIITTSKSSPNPTAFNLDLVPIPLMNGSNGLSLSYDPMLMLYEEMTKPVLYYLDQHFMLTIALLEDTYSSFRLSITTTPINKSQFKDLIESDLGDDDNCSKNHYNHNNHQKSPQHQHIPNTSLPRNPNALKNSTTLTLPVPPSPSHDLLRDDYFPPIASPPKSPISPVNNTHNTPKSPISSTPTSASPQEQQPRSFMSPNSPQEVAAAVIPVTPTMKSPPNPGDENGMVFHGDIGHHDNNTPNGNNNSSKNGNNNHSPYLTPRKPDQTPYPSTPNTVSLSAPPRSVEPHVSDVPVMFSTLSINLHDDEDFITNSLLLNRLFYLYLLLTNREWCKIPRVYRRTGQIGYQIVQDDGYTGHKGYNNRNDPPQYLLPSHSYNSPSAYQRDTPNGNGGMSPQHRSMSLNNQGLGLQQQQYDQSNSNNMRSSNNTPKSNNNNPNQSSTSRSSNPLNQPLSLSQHPSSRSTTVVNVNHNYNGSNNDNAHRSHINTTNPNNNVSDSIKKSSPLPNHNSGRSQNSNRFDDIDSNHHESGSISGFENDTNNNAMRSQNNPNDSSNHPIRSLNNYPTYPPELASQFPQNQQLGADGQHVSSSGGQFGQGEDALHLDENSKENSLFDFSTIFYNYQPTFPTLDGIPTGQTLSLYLYSDLFFDIESIVMTKALKVGVKQGEILSSLLPSSQQQKQKQQQYPTLTTNNFQSPYQPKTSPKQYGTHRRNNSSLSQNRAGVDSFVDFEKRSQHNYHNDDNDQNFQSHQQKYQHHNIPHETHSFSLDSLHDDDNYNITFNNGNNVNGGYNHEEIENIQKSTQMIEKMQKCHDLLQNFQLFHHLYHYHTIYSINNISNANFQSSSSIMHMFNQLQAVVNDDHNNDKKRKDDNNTPNNNNNTSYSSIIGSITNNISNSISAFDLTNSLGSFGLLNDKNNTNKPKKSFFSHLSSLLSSQHLTNSHRSTTGSMDDDDDVDQDDMGMFDLYGKSDPISITDFQTWVQVLSPFQLQHLSTTLPPITINKDRYEVVMESYISNQQHNGVIHPTTLPHSTSLLDSSASFIDHPNLTSSPSSITNATNTPPGKGYIDPDSEAPQLKLISTTLSSVLFETKTKFNRLITSSNYRVSRPYLTTIIDGVYGYEPIGFYSESNKFATSRTLSQSIKQRQQRHKYQSNPETALNSIIDEYNRGCIDDNVQEFGYNDGDDMYSNNTNTNNGSNTTNNNLHMNNQTLSSSRYPSLNSHPNQSDNNNNNNNNNNSSSGNDTNGELTTPLHLILMQKFHSLIGLNDEEINTHLEYEYDQQHNINSSECDIIGDIHGGIDQITGDFNSGNDNYKITTAHHTNNIQPSSPSNLRKKSSPLSQYNAKQQQQQQSGVNWKEYLDAGSTVGPINTLNNGSPTLSSSTSPSSSLPSQPSLSNNQNQFTYLTGNNNTNSNNSAAKKLQRQLNDPDLLNLISYNDSYDPCSESTQYYQQELSHCQHRTVQQTPLAIHQRPKHLQNVNRVHYGLTKRGISAVVNEEHEEMSDKQMLYPIIVPLSSNSTIKSTPINNAGNSRDAFGVQMTPQISQSLLSVIHQSDGIITGGGVISEFEKIIDISTKKHAFSSHQINPSHNNHHGTPLDSNGPVRRNSHVIGHQHLVENDHTLLTLPTLPVHNFISTIQSRFQVHHSYQKDKGQVNQNQPKPQATSSPFLLPNSSFTDLITPPQLNINFPAFSMAQDFQQRLQERAQSHIDLSNNDNDHFQNDNLQNHNPSQSSLENDKTHTSIASKPITVVSKKHSIAQDGNDNNNAQGTNPNNKKGLIWNGVKWVQLVEMDTDNNEEDDKSSSNHDSINSFYDNDDSIEVQPIVKKKSKKDNNAPTQDDMQIARSLLTLSKLQNQQWESCVGDEQNETGGIPVQKITQDDASAVYLTQSSDKPRQNQQKTTLPSSRSKISKVPRLLNNSSDELEPILPIKTPTSVIVQPSHSGHSEVEIIDVYDDNNHDDAAISTHLDDIDHGDVINEDDLDEDNESPCDGNDQDKEEFYDGQNQDVDDQDDQDNEDDEDNSDNDIHNPTSSNHTRNPSSSSVHGSNMPMDIDFSNDFFAQSNNHSINTSNASLSSFNNTDDASLECSLTNSSITSSLTNSTNPSEGSFSHPINVEDASLARSFTNSTNTTQGEEPESSPETYPNTGNQPPPLTLSQSQSQSLHLVESIDGVGDADQDVEGDDDDNDKNTTIMTTDIVPTPTNNTIHPSNITNNDGFNGDDSCLPFLQQLKIPTGVIVELQDFTFDDLLALHYDDLMSIVPNQQVVSAIYLGVLKYKKNHGLQ